MLPQEFLDRMKEMLGEEYPAFLDSYEREKYQALRINTLKAEKEAFLAKAPFTLEQVPWMKDGFYYGSTDCPGKHPYHEAGVYYIQEPSAMAPVEYLMEGEIAAGRMGERILDLCAAPGGKSTQIAAAMQGCGVLISNEIHPARAKILSENIERMGVFNAMVTNETPQKLAEIFHGFFTRILVDAPCSGEGMFRKKEVACEEWSLSNVQLCAKRQDEILACAASMLAPGGRLVYSTCTFASAENEGTVSRFLTRHPEFSIQKTKKFPGMQGGVAAWADEPLEEIGETIRLWPHKLNGEGHYLAVLKKAGTIGNDKTLYCSNGFEKGISSKDLNIPGKGILEFLQFAKEELKKQPEGTYLKFGEQLYLAPAGMPSMKGLKVLRPGLHLGTIKKNRFEPSHALAMGLRPEDAVHTVDLRADGTVMRGYFNGQTFACDGEKGWYLITVDGYSAGWGKLAGGIMKNHYPKGLRKNL